MPQGSRFPAILCVLLAGVSSLPAQAPVKDADVADYIGKLMVWYREAAAMEQSRGSSREAVFADTLRKSVGQTIRSALQLARGQAAQPGKTSAAHGDDRSRRLIQAGAANEQRIEGLQAEIEQYNRELHNSPERLRADMLAKRDKAVAELNFCKARREALQSLLSFMNSSDKGGLAARIPDLERLAAEGDAPSGSRSAAQDFYPESAGIAGLSANVLATSRRMSRLAALARHTEELRQQAETLRAPLRGSMQDIIRRGDTLAQIPDDAAAAELTAARKELEALLAQFKQVSSVSSPLAQQVAQFNAARANLEQWRATLEDQNGSALRYLLFRLAVLGFAILATLLFSALWQRGTMRYVQDVRRRRQILLLRRIVVGCTIAVLVLLSFVTEFGSIATFAGFSAAGIAVAMQSVILSVVAYFFLVGRWGVRVGDRITVSGVTGDVIDIGLFRVYLMELAKSGPDMQATGRIVVFPNAVFFQPSALFKQFPGINYTWRTVSMTLPPYGDYSALEKQLLTAVELIYAEYREAIEKQHRAAQTTDNLHTPTPRPETRLRFADGGIEFSVRYPVEMRCAAEIDDRVTRELMTVIDRHPAVLFTRPPKVQAAG